jgi:hypothetical protein
LGDRITDCILENRIFNKIFRVYALTQVLLIGCAGFAIYRYFWVYGKIASGECLFVSLTGFVMLWIALNALWKGHRADPGFLYVQSKKNDDYYDACRKCGASRPDEHTHHCSSCNKCVLAMDHHCYLMGNCVGKHTLKYFVQYSVWLSLLLAFAIYGIYIKAFYYQNRQFKTGVQSLTELRPHLVLLYIMSIIQPLPKQIFWSNYYGQVPDDFFLIILDNWLISFSAGFLVFAVAVLYQTLSNIRNHTSEPGKLKHKGAPTKVRSISEMCDHIFGKNATLW